MKKRILVSSNCQTNGIAKAMRQFFPEAIVEAIPLAGDQNVYLPKISEALSKTDIWISSGAFALLEDLAIEDVRLVKIPQITFNAFHPDLVYVRNRQTGDFIRPDYNSFICAWSFKNGLGSEDCVKLFNADVYELLGYFNAWDGSVSYLSKVFSESDINFDKFFLKVQRHGLFMHSINHPRVEAMRHFSTLIAQKIDPLSSIVESELPDTLSGDVWAFYPEIASNLSLNGSYDWKLTTFIKDGPKFLHSIQEMVDFYYQIYSSSTTDSDLIILRTVEANVEQALKSFARR